MILTFIEQLIIIENLQVKKELISFMQLKLKQKPQVVSVYQRKQVKTKQLNHIVELTQQNQTCRQNKDEVQIQRVKLIKKQQQQSNQSEKQIDLKGWMRYFGCVQKIFRKLKKKPVPGKQMDINESQFTELVQKIRRTKNTSVVVLPVQSQPKRVLVLDLDQTLIHSSFTRPDQYDFQIQITYNGQNAKVYTIKRFGLESFLFQMSKIYQIIVFTASQKQYADKIIEMIDPKGRISHVLYRDHCLIINKLYFLKNLKILGRDLKGVIMVDDNKMAGILQPENYFKIEQFMGSQKDHKLVQLASFLKHLQQLKNILPISQTFHKFQDIEIKIKDESTTKSQLMQENNRKQKRRQYRHKKVNSEVESLFTADSQRQNENKIDSQVPSRNQYEETGVNLVKNQC